MTDTNQTGPAREGSTERCANDGCGHTKRDHSGRRDHTTKHPDIPLRPWCHACATDCLYEPPAASAPVSPAPADRAAKAESLLLRFAAEAHRRKWAYDRGLDDDGVPIKSEAFDALHRLGEEMRTALDNLRRMADAASGPGGVAGETPQPETQAEEAHPAEHVWAAELYDPLAEQWVPGTRYSVREYAVNHLDHARTIGPTWKDGTPTQRRLVRTTTTYTVEQPAAVSQPDGEA